MSAEVHNADNEMGPEPRPLTHSDPWPHVPDDSFFANVLRPVLGGLADEQTLQAAQRAIAAAIKESARQNPFAPSFLSEENLQDWTKVEDDMEHLAYLEEMDWLRRSGNPDDHIDF